MKKAVLIFLSSTALLASVFLILSGVFSAPSKYEGKIVRKIIFTGLQNVDEDDLYEVLITAEGFPFRSTDIRKDIKSVFSKGQFENVVVEVEDFRDGVSVRFVCKERPLVNDIVYLGTDELSEMEFTELVLVKEGEVLRYDFLEKSIKAIKKKYADEGFFNAVVKYQVKKHKKKENEVDVYFIIDEGEEIKVERFSILGAKKIPDVELLKVVETEEKGVFKDGDFKKDIYEQDKTKIIAYYKERGYLDAQILDDKVDYEWADPEKKEIRAIFITIKLSEGEKYYFDKYTIAGNKVIESKVLDRKSVA